MITSSGFILPGTAALDGGRFFVHAQNDESPEIEATAGMNGRDAGGPGTPSDGDKVLATYSCGPGTFSYTQSMKDLTESNLALHEQGRDSEMKLGPGGWEAVKALDVSAAELGADATIVFVGDIELAQYSTFTEAFEAGDFTTVFAIGVAPRAIGPTQFKSSDHPPELTTVRAFPSACSQKLLDATTPSRSMASYLARTEAPQHSLWVQMRPILIGPPGQLLSLRMECSTETVESLRLSQFSKAMP